MESFPTPLSTELIKGQQKIDSYQEKVVNSYNTSPDNGFSELNNNSSTSGESTSDSNIISNFLNSNK